MDDTSFALQYAAQFGSDHLIKDAAYMAWENHCKYGTPYPPSSGEMRKLVEELEQAQAYSRMEHR